MEANNTNSTSRKILVVDDEPEIVSTLQLSLEQSGYKVRTAFSGAQALEEAVTFQPDLVLLDVMMPHMDGFEVLRRLKENPQTAHIIVVMLTARTAYKDMQEGWDGGSDLYLEKPFRMGHLLEYIGCVLSD